MRRLYEYDPEAETATTTDAEDGSTFDLPPLEGDDPGGH